MEINLYDTCAEDGAYDFLASRISGAEQSLSFLNDKYNDVYAWRAAGKRRVAELMFNAPEPEGYDAITIDETDFGQYTRKTVYFNSAPGPGYTDYAPADARAYKDAPRGRRIPAYLLTPKNIIDKAPGVVVLHDHGGMFFWGKDKAVEHKEDIPQLKNYARDYYGAPLASTLAKRGYVTLVIDSLYFGERRFKFERHGEFAPRLNKHEYASPGYVDEFNACAREAEGDLAKLFFGAGLTFMGVRAADDIASVGYLSSLGCVDPKRIGCIGLSMGGMRSAWLAALDDRVKCAVAVGTMQRYREMMAKRLMNYVWLWIIPGLYGEMDYPEAVSLRAPLPLYAMHGKRDGLYPDNTGEAAIEHIRAVYEKAGAAENFKYSYYDEEHVFNEAMQTDAFNWMDSYLKR